MFEYLEVHIGKFTFKVATDRLYTGEGVWVLAVDGALRIGISDYFQQHSGDVAFMDVRRVGTALKVGEEIAAIETIKVNISLASPVAGKIVRDNPLLETAPEMINQDPYGEGWLCEVEPDDWELTCKKLLDPTSYFDLVKREAENEDKQNDRS